MRNPDRGLTIKEAEADQVWQLLKASPESVLIDIRSCHEWMWVGVPDLSPLGLEPVFLEWQIFPEKIIDGLFTQKLGRILKKRKVTRNSNLFFICRSGIRSQAAAKAVTLAGYQSCTNVKGGFEGPLDDKARRGKIDGWKAAGLPWVQS